jgi:hypothetical protein
MTPLQTIHERYVALFGNDHATAAVRGNEEQPSTPEFSRAAPHSSSEARP